MRSWLVGLAVAMGCQREGLVEADASSGSTTADEPPLDSSGLGGSVSGDASPLDSSGLGGSVSGDASPLDSSGSTGDSSTDVTSYTSDTGTSDTGTSNTGTSDTGTSDTGSEPACGNGIVEAGESCDAGGASATCDEDCTAALCGDAVVNALAGEACDAADLAGGTCEGLGFGIGVLACDAACAYETSGCSLGVPVLVLNASPIKRFDFSWAPVGAEYYQLLESTAPGEPYVQLGGDIVGESASFEMPLHFRREASYVLRACAGGVCNDSAAVDVVGSLAEAVGYVKAFNARYFGWSVALSADGSTLAVGAMREDSSATGIDGDQADLSAPESGAVYVFVRDGVGAWSQQAYVKASNTEAGDYFGHSVALSADGSTLAVGASRESSNATGIDGDQGNNLANLAGAVYVFARDGMGAWSQQAYVKASNTQPNDPVGFGDLFGYSVALSADGSTLAVGAHHEDSSATGIDGNQADESALFSGAVYVFVRSGLGVWSQQAYIKASNPDGGGPFIGGDVFGAAVALSADGNTLAVGAEGEDSSATGIDGDQANDSTSDAGAVYVFIRDAAGTWSQQAYVKASNTDEGDRFGKDVALSGDGNILAVGANGEDSSATGVGGDQADDGANLAGAAYVLERDAAGTWSHQAYVKASNTGTGDEFGLDVALSADGNTLAVGAQREDSDATGIGGDQASNLAPDSGAVYVLVRDGAGAWQQQAYVKASNTGAGDRFSATALSGDGNTLAVSAWSEDSNATVIGGNQADESRAYAGAVYLY